MAHELSPEEEKAREAAAKRRTPEEIKRQAVRLGKKVSQLSDSMKDYYEKCFQRYDRDNSETLEAPELQKVMMDIGMAPTTKEEQKMYGQVLQQILEVSRSEGMSQEDEDGDSSMAYPVDTRDVKWTFHEFLMMVMAMIEIHTAEEDRRVSMVASDLGFMEEEVAGFKEIFDSFDRDGSGDVSIDEMKLILRAVGMANVSDEDLQKTVRQFDKDGDGTLDFKEFLKFMKKLGSDLEEKEQSAQASKQVGFLPPA